MIHAEPQAVPPRIRTGLPLTLFAGAIFVFVVMCALAFIYFFNPSTHGFYPRCLFHQLTGLNCPGCGSTRALYALLHGQIQTALRDNALFIISLAGGGHLGHAVSCPKAEESRAGTLSFTKIWMGIFGCRCDVHHPAEPSGVFVPFALGFLAFAAGAAGVQFLNYEPDTSIDNNNIRTAGISRDQVIWSGSRHHGAFTIGRRQHRCQHPKSFRRKYLALHESLRAGPGRHIQPDAYSRRAARRQRGDRRAL